MKAANPLQPSLEIFSTCPQSAVANRGSYLQEVITAAQWSERAGCTGILVYSDNSQIDPWLLSQIIIEHTSHLCPLVAVQPVYMHPHTAATMVSTLGYLFRRRVYLNMVAGGFKNDLTALGDDTPHDARYSRLIEYTTILNRLLTSPLPVSHDGEFYRVEHLRMFPPLDPDLAPRIFVSGSSESGLAAAKALHATAIHYPEPSGQYAERFPEDSGRHGIRIGIVARESERTAWEVAHHYFPADRRGQLTQQVAMKISDSAWHRQLSRLGDTTTTNPYWLVPFQNYKTFCPYLVGSYDQVASELAAYIRCGMHTFILDIPRTEEDLVHINAAFRRASELLPCQSYCKTG
ncbi:MAG TPA: LLM class flavin-dependent oxidoreductase [Chloroflexota bacterium]|nr:LLM class flavin-dependent oxidoreductase [Chloroflexota bacterium]